MMPEHSNSTFPTLPNESAAADQDCDRLLRLAALSERLAVDRIAHDARSAAERIAEGRHWIILDHLQSPPNLSRLTCETWWFLAPRSARSRSCPWRRSASIPSPGESVCSSLSCRQPCSG